MRLWIDREVVDEIANLPGNIRQRIRRAIRALPTNPYPEHSRMLEVAEDLRVPGIQAYRLRIDQWRVIYVIDQDADQINILAVRRRPPYNYDDLQDILG
jgi:mRNA interferase RelE/StbE